MNHSRVKDLNKQCVVNSRISLFLEVDRLTLESTQRKLSKTEIRFLKNASYTIKDIKLVTKGGDKGVGPVNHSGSTR